MVHVWGQLDKHASCSSPKQAGGGPFQPFCGPALACLEQS